MKWNPKTGLSGHTCVEEDDLWIGGAWLGRGLVGSFLGFVSTGFNAWGWVSCAWFCTSDENWGSGASNPDGGGINFLSPDRKLESSGRLKFSWWPEESMRGIFINKKDEGCVRRKGKVEIIFLNDRRKIMSYRVIEEDLTFFFSPSPTCPSPERQLYTSYGWRVVIQCNCNDCLTHVRALF